MAQKQEWTLEQLEIFYRKAALATYASEQKPDPTSPKFIARPGGFKQYTFREGRLSYDDGYAGFKQSGGMEVVLFDDVAIWYQCYGGGIQIMSTPEEQIHKIFSFLKKAMSQKTQVFQPRGPDFFELGNHYYSCIWTGDITKFAGTEAIYEDSGLVFQHQFFGGLIVWKK